METSFWFHFAQWLERLLELDPDERASQLSMLRRNKPDLADQLEAALAADQSSIPLLDLPLKFDFRDHALRPDEAEELKPGTMVGPWRLVRELGRGGMGRVWLASRDDDQYRVDVALKLIDFALHGDLVSVQIRIERQILADLDHPQIARLLDGGMRDNGTPWYAMEYVRGLPLDEYCSQNSLSLSERLRLIERTARVVQHAHAHLVVHRDLKPSNILVNGDGNPHLVDFGIAKLLDKSNERRPGTITLLAASTPAYAAPEQLRGESVGTRADIYSLGVIAYELISGKRPPRADSEAMSGDSALAPLVSRAIRGNPRLRSRVRGDVDSIVSQAMAPLAEARYVSAATFADDIERHLTGMPVAARRAGSFYRAGKFLHRHWLGVGLTASLVVILSASLVFSVVQTYRAENALAHATAVQGFLLEVFDASTPGPADIGIVLQRDLIERAAERLDQLQALDPHDRLDLTVGLGRVFRKLGLAEQAEQILRQAVEALDDSQVSLTDSRFVEALYELGRANYYTGDFSSGLSSLVRANQLAVELGPRYDGPHRAAILFELGATQSALRQTRHAMQTLAEAASLASDDSSAHELLPRIMVLQAITLGRDNQLDQAIVVGEEAVSSARSILGLNHERTASALSTVGAMNRRAGNLDVAERMLREAHRIEINAYGQAQSATMNNLANVLMDLGHLDQAGRYFTRALELAEVRFGSDSPGAASYRRNLALYQVTAGYPVEAVANLQSAYDSYARAYPIDSGINLNMRSQLSWALLLAGKADEAEDLLAEIFNRAGSMTGVARAALWRSHMVSASASYRKGRIPLAMEHIESAVAQMDAYPIERADQVRFFLLAGDVYAAAERLDRSRASWERALELARSGLGRRHPLDRAVAVRQPAVPQAPGSSRSTDLIAGRPQ